MAEIKIGRKDLIWSYLGTFIRLGVNIILLPLVLKYLTDDELGLWYVFCSISALTTLLDFGFAPALSRNISYVWCGAKELKKTDLIRANNSETDFEYFKTVLYTCKYIYLIIALCSLFILLVPGAIYIINISSTEVIPSWFVYSTGVFLNILFSYYSTFLRGVGAVAENNIAAVYSRLTQIIVTIPLLLLGYGLMGVSVAYLLSGFALRIYSRYAFYRYEGIGQKIKGILVIDKIKKSIDLFKIVWHNASKDGLVTLSNYLSTQANTLISSALIGLSATGSYGISVQLASIIGTLAFVPFTTNHPAMQEKSISGDVQGSKQLFSTSIFMYIVLFVLMSIGLIVLQPIIVWLKPSFSLSITMLIALLFFNFIYNLYNLFCSYISTFNKIPYSNAFILTAFTSVILSFILTKYFNMGIWALILAPLVVSLSYNVWKWPKYVFDNYLHMTLVEYLNMGYKMSVVYVKKLINI